MHLSLFNIDRWPKNYTIAPEKTVKFILTKYSLTQCELLFDQNNGASAGLGLMLSRSADLLKCQD